MKTYIVRLIALLALLVLLPVLALAADFAVVRGGRLTGARVAARDLRGGAALTLAGLCAEGVTEVEGVPLIDRGYEALDEALNALGADIRRI